MIDTIEQHLGDKQKWNWNHTHQVRSGNYKNMAMLLPISRHDDVTSYLKMISD